MKTSLKTLFAGAAALAGVVAMAVPASAQSFGIGFGPNGGISFSVTTGGYCDSFGCPDTFWNLPVYYGQVYYAGRWYDGPVYYRVWHGQRQYWVHGGWHTDQWRGARPSWWREGRYGPALGVDYYRNHGFHGRWDNDRGPGFNQRRDDHGPQQFNDNRGNDNRGNFNPRGGNPGNRPLDRRNAAPAPAASPHTAPPAATSATPAQNDHNGDGRGRGDRGGRGQPPQQ